MLYRIDSFNLPDAARPQFERRAKETLALLRRQPGFVRDQWFEKVSGEGSFNIVTMVEWEDDTDIQTVAQAVRAMHAENGFDPAAFTRLYGIVESKALYKLRDTETST